jgi:hypothetical protein
VPESFPRDPARGAPPQICEGRPTPQTHPDFLKETLKPMLPSITITVGVLAWLTFSAYQIFWRVP